MMRRPSASARRQAVARRSARAPMKARARGLDVAVNALDGRGARLRVREARRHGNRGSGTVWMIALMAMVWLVAMVAMSAGGVRAARHRAHAAADLAALAAASHAMGGSVRACGVAATVARAARARLTRCALRARIAGVSVVAASQIIGFGPVQISATARAGPVHRPATQDTAAGAETIGPYGSGE